VPIILATWEAAIGRIPVQGQCWQKIHETIAGHSGTGLSSQGTLEAEIRGSWLQAKPSNKVNEILIQQKKLGVVVHACHPSYSGKYKIE
jgi:hypothetical protein